MKCVIAKPFEFFLLAFVSSVLFDPSALYGSGCLAPQTQRQMADEPIDSEALRIDVLTESLIPNPVTTAAEYLKWFDGRVDHPELFSYRPIELPDDEANKLAQELRKRFPFVSLNERLQPMNQPKRVQRLREFQPLKTNDSETSTEEDGGVLNAYAFGSLRRRALAELHSEQVVRFVNQDGFGLDRMIPISPMELPYEKPGPIALDTESGLLDVADSEWIPLPESASTESSTAGVVPTVEQAEGLNHSATTAFTTDDRIGHVVDRDHVAGFVGHGIDYLGTNTLPLQIGRSVTPEERDFWKLNRLELVSLLAHDDFRVYVSESLPQMEQLESTKTRKLDSFEMLALGKLLRGEDVIAASQNDRIRMLGAIRVQESCTECHSMKRGELIGAFSYELLRKSK
ncbi:MAG: hypothetical protein R3C03_08190 [Pirellulaceae bacterium]